MLLLESKLELAVRVFSACLCQLLPESMSTTQIHAETIELLIKIISRINRSPYIPDDSIPIWSSERCIWPEHDRNLFHSIGSRQVDVYSEAFRIDL